MAASPSQLRGGGAPLAGSKRLLCDALELEGDEPVDGVSFGSEEEPGDMPDDGGEIGSDRQRAAEIRAVRDARKASAKAPRDRTGWTEAESAALARLHTVITQKHGKNGAGAEGGRGGGGAAE